MKVDIFGHLFHVYHSVSEITTFCTFLEQVVAWFSLLYPTAAYTSLATRHWPTSGTCTALMFLPLKLNDSTTKRWTERDIFICSSFWSKFLHPVTRHKKRHIHAYSFSVSFFLSSGTHQFHHLHGCQAMGINSSFIFTFWAFFFWWLLSHFIITSSSHGPICCSLTNQLGTYFNNHGLPGTALSHILFVLTLLSPGGGRDHFSQRQI